MSGLIPQHFIDHVLSRINIIDVINTRIKLKKTGRNYSAKCPFHNENTPSFSVNPDKQFYYCFGCGASGNAITFIINFDNLEFPDAIKTLAENVGLEIPKETVSTQPNIQPLYQLITECATYFQNELKNIANDAPVIRYLKNRGLNGKICKQFGIGYAPKGWKNIYNHFIKSHSKEQLLQVGMLIENDESKQCYDRFRDRIMFPIKDTRGRVIAFGGRSLEDKKPKYLNSPESFIFHKSQELYGLFEAKKNQSINSIIVVEGYMDVIALAQLGIKNAVATLGTATTPDHIQLLFKHTDKVIFCFDGDQAGKKAAWKALDSTLPVMQDGKHAHFLFLPNNEDPDSLVRKEGASQFTNRIESALSLDTFLFNQLTQTLDLSTLSGRARLAHLAKPYLQKLPKGVFRQLALQQLSTLTGLDTQQAQEHMIEPSNTITENSSRYSQTPNQKPAIISRQTQSTPATKTPLIQIDSALYAIRHLMLNTSLAKEVNSLELLAQDNNTDTLLLVDLLQALKDKPNLSASTLIAQWIGTSQGNRLQYIAQLELGLNLNDQEFWEAIKRITNKIQARQYKNSSNNMAILLSNKKPNQLNNQQRQELLDLIQQKKDSLKK